MFTKIINVVQLFTNPTVVTVQPTLSCVRGLRDGGASTFLAAQTIFYAIGQAIFESDFVSTFSYQIQVKSRGFTPASLTLSNLGLLLTSVVHQTHFCSVVTVDNNNIV